MRKIIVVFLIYHLFIPGNLFAKKRIKKWKIETDLTQKKFIQHGGFIENINDRIIKLYEHQKGVRQYRLSSQCKIISKVENDSFELNIDKKSFKRVLKRGYKVKVLINPTNNLVETIYIQEIPK